MGGVRGVLEVSTGRELSVSTSQEKARLKYPAMHKVHMAS